MRNLDEALFLNEWIARNIFKKTVVRLPAYKADNDRWTLYTTDFNWRLSLSPPLANHIQSLLDTKDPSIRCVPCWRKQQGEYELVPDFSGDMKATHLMEKELQMLGLRDHYISGLIKARHSSQDFYWFLLHDAGPAIRCQTAKEVVAGLPKTVTEHCRAQEA